MAFKFPKSAENIQGTVILPAGYYRMRLVKEPAIEPNRKKKDGLPPSEGAGDNFVLRLRIISDDPVENGRAFTKWLPMPTENDANEFDQFTGQPMLDRKMESIVKWVEAFGGTIAGDEFDLRAGGEAAVAVIVEDREGTPVNSIDMNADPKPLS
ncbi:MAG: hypothetical protein WC083_06810 [Candidatus Methanomethylophilaceae archaeon]